MHHVFSSCAKQLPRHFLALPGTFRYSLTGSFAQMLHIALGAERVPYDGVVPADTLSAADVRAWAKVRWPAQLAHLADSDIRITVAARPARCGGIALRCIRSLAQLCAMR